MTTITSTQLLDNLSEIIEHVKKGEHIIVTYRRKIVFQIKPVG